MSGWGRGDVSGGGGGERGVCVCVGGGVEMEEEYHYGGVEVKVGVGMENKDIIGRGVSATDNRESVKMGRESASLWWGARRERAPGI